MLLDHGALPLPNFQDKYPTTLAKKASIGKILMAHFPYLFTAALKVLLSECTSHLKRIPYSVISFHVNEDNIVGRGAFGIVYRGEFMGMKVAIKKIEFVDEHKGPKLQHEIGMLRFNGVISSYVLVC
jgi:hypothetical protein